jgi:hypothetical protein
VKSKESLYIEVAKALNNDFRSVLKATATEVGICVAAKMALDYHRLWQALKNHVRFMANV